MVSVPTMPFAVRAVKGNSANSGQPGALHHSFYPTGLEGIA